MHECKKVRLLLLVGPVLAFLTCGAQAATVNISGVTPSFAGYSNSGSSKNNVINAPGSATTSGVTDNTAGATYKGSAAGGGNPAVVTTTLSNYLVDWFFVGGESGFNNQLIIAGLPTTTEHDENSNCCGAGSQGGVVHIGSVQGTNPIIDFTLNDQQGSTLSNGALNPAQGSGVASLVFSYLNFLGGNQWSLTSTATDWFLLGWNDGGGPDDDRDDLMALAHVTPVPVPAALPLFAGGLGLLGWMARRRRAYALTRPSQIDR